MERLRLYVKSIILSAVVIICGAVSTSARDIDLDAGTSGAAFLKIPVGARAAAMGKTYTGVGMDIHSLEYNPAGLGFIRGVEVTATHNEFLSDIQLEYLALGKRFSSLGTFAFQGKILRQGDITRTLETTAGLFGGTSGKFTARDLALGFAYARTLRKTLSLGITIKYIDQKIDRYNATGVGADLGAMFRSIDNRWALGASIQNIGTDLRFISQKNPLPFTYKLGGSYYLIRNRLMLALDLSIPRDDNLRVNAGAELNISDILSLRGGYDSANDLDNGFTFGIGFNIKDVHLDYAFRSGGELGNIHDISGTIKFRLPGKKRVHKPIVKPAPEKAVEEETGAPVELVSVDRDSDGILDRDDLAPDSPENFNGWEDEDGAPDKIPRIIIVDNISYTVTPESNAVLMKKTLDAVYMVLKYNPSLCLSITAYTDNIGSSEFNEYLTGTLAEHLEDYFRDRYGGRVKSRGRGDSNPVGDNLTGDGRTQNRRVEFSLKYCGEDNK